MSYSCHVTVCSWSWRITWTQFFVPRKDFIVTIWYNIWRSWDTVNACCNLPQPFPVPTLLLKLLFCICRNWGTECDQLVCWAAALGPQAVSVVISLHLACCAKQPSVLQSCLVILIRSKWGVTSATLRGRPTLLKLGKYSLSSVDFISTKRIQRERLSGGSRVGVGLWSVKVKNENLLGKIRSKKKQMEYFQIFRGRTFENTPLSKNNKIAGKNVQNLLVQNSER